MNTRGLGYVVDEHSDRDRLFSAQFAETPSLTLPSSVDFLDKVVEILDQGPLGSCVANAGFGAIRTVHKRMGVVYPKLGNRLHGYWGARAYAGEIAVDGGSMIRNFFRFINDAGYMPEENTAYKYDVSTFTEGPNRREQRRMFDQKNHSDGKVRYLRINETLSLREERIKQALAGTNPVVFGTAVTDAIRTYSDGVLERPTATQPIIGGHAMYLVGYDSEGCWFVNSWSSAWGMEGFGKISWDYLCWDQTSDLWVVDKAPYYSGAK